MKWYLALGIVACMSVVAGLIRSLSLSTQKSVSLSPVTSSSPQSTHSAPEPLSSPAPLPTPSPRPSPHTSRAWGWGAYTGYTVAAKTAFEKRVGAPMNYVAVFVHWGNENEFPAEMAAEAKRANQTLVIFWEAKDYTEDNLDDARFAYQAIIRGDWDTYIHDFGEQIRHANQPVILIPFEEVNGDWSPWSLSHNGNTADLHRQAYQKIARMLSGVPHLQMGWTANNDSVPDTADNSIASLYPGNEYVDIIGIDGFNFGDPWQSVDAIFDTPLAAEREYGKPIMLFSTASAEEPRKAEWITRLGSYIESHPEIHGFIWFNENKEKNWLVWSDTDSLTAFRALVKRVN